MDKPLVLHSASITVVASCYCGKRFTQGLTNVVIRGIGVHGDLTAKEFYGEVICPDCGTTYKTTVGPTTLITNKRNHLY